MDVTDERTTDLNPVHAAYVAKGYCASVHWPSDWCVQQDGHAGQHWSLRIPNDVTKRFVVAHRWD